MTLLVASVVALAIAPLLWMAAQRSPPLLQVLDGFVFVAIGGLVLLHVFPDALEQAGWWALLAGAVGMLTPTLVEARLESSARHAHMTALLLATLGLVLHGLLDGVVLQGVAEGGKVAAGAGYAVALHQLPEGLMIWSLLRPAFGKGFAAATLAAMALAVICGFTIGAPLSGTLSSVPMGLFLGLVGGSLLHVVVHRPHSSHDGVGERASYLPAGIGAIGGMSLLLLLELWESTRGDLIWSLDQVAAMVEHGSGSVFLSLCLQSAPALLFAYLAAGMVQAFLPKATVAWLSRGSTLAQAGRGMIFGLPLPLCSCGVIPVYRSLVLRGAPPAAAISFLVATPELGLDAVLLSVPLLGVPMTGARVVCAALAALLVGWWLGRVVDAGAHSTLPNVDGDEFAGMNAAQRFASGLRTGFGEMVDGTAPWIVVGLVVAALAAPMIDPEWLLRVPDPLEVLLCAALGMPVYVCASGATPLVAVLLAAGISPGAGIAFLLAGPATNITTFGVLSSLHGRKASFAFAAAVTGACVFLGLVVNVALPSVGAGAFQAAGEHSYSSLQWLSCLTLALVYLASVLRQGPRNFVAQLSFGEHGEHDHKHDGEDAGHCH